MGKVTYSEDNRIKLVFSSLVINVASIEKNCRSFKDFIEKNDLYGVTNGKLFVISEMTNPPYTLIEYAEKILIPQGFKEKEDYIFAEEQLIYGVDQKPSPYLNHPHPDCRNISWVDSLITTEGNFVWLRELHNEEKPIRKWSLKGMEAYSHWKESSNYGYIEGLWKKYNSLKPSKSFTEFVRDDNKYKSLNTAKGLIETWEKVKKHRDYLENQPVILLGALAGDIVGSKYERLNIKTTKFPLFDDMSKYTDDSVMTIAVATKLLMKDGSYIEQLQEFGRRYRTVGYGSNFKEWIFSEYPKSYGSYGNGSAMRVSPVGYAFDIIEDVLIEAEQSAKITHNHPEGIKGAQAIATGVFLARSGRSKKEIKEYISETFNYDLNRTIDEIRPIYQFDISCQGSVPEAIISFLESTDFESALRNAVSLGGDSDTMASIAGALAEAFYKHIPAEIKHKVMNRIPDEFKEVLLDFTSKFNI